MSFHTIHTHTVTPRMEKRTQWHSSYMPTLESQLHPSLSFHFLSLQISLGELLDQHLIQRLLPPAPVFYTLLSLLTGSSLTTQQSCGGCLRSVMRQRMRRPLAGTAYIARMQKHSHPLLFYYWYIWKTLLPGSHNSAPLTHRGTHGLCSRLVFQE